MKNLGNFS